jgi:hypothetical protein
MHEFSDAGRIGIVRREGVPVSNEEKTVVVILERFPIVQCAEQVAQVQ